MHHVSAVTIMEAANQQNMDNNNVVKRVNTNINNNNINNNDYGELCENKLSINNNNINNNNNEYKEKMDDIEEDDDIHTYFGIKFKSKLKWINIIAITIFHGLALYGILWKPNAKVATLLWALFLGNAGGFGVTGGVHRLWSHKAYKAKWPLRVILMICYSIAGQNTIYDWVRDHRVHHKFSETNADPHNSNRGFFFAHVGWLMMNKHREVLKKGKTIDMSDILSDPVVQFHQRFFLPMKLLFCFFIPTFVPMYFWGESFYTSFIALAVIRYILNLNFTWLVNSAAHMWGSRPYDNKINPVENLTVAIVAMGEGWHNYHHVFPWDYKAAELGDYKVNVTTLWIDLFAKIGWAYDLKQPSKELIKKTVQKCGDGSHATFGHHLSEVPPPEEDENANTKK